MPSSTSSSDRRRGLWLWIGLFCAVWLGCGGLLLLSAHTRPPYGDLTRVGALSDELFGWQAAQPAVPASQLQSAPVAEADILVIGDSFSLPPGPHRDEGLVWQSRLVAAGHRVATVHWDRAHPLCPDFPAWIHSLGFQGRWVLFESIERELANRLTAPHPCSGPPRPGPEGFATRQPITQPPPATRNWHERLLTGALTLWHSHRARQATGTMTFRDPTASDTARLHLVPDGCTHFSHALCDRALFLSDDEDRPRLQSAHVAAMVALGGAMHPWRLAWVVIPNKTTYYLDRETVQGAFAELPARQLGPDLLQAMAAAGATRKDVFFPNDSHLSTTGSLLLGDAVLQWLNQATLPR